MRWALEILSLLLLLALVGLVATQWSGLPDTIPTHFGASGVADHHGDKNTIWMLPAAGMGVYLLLTLLVRVALQKSVRGPAKIVFVLLALMKAEIMAVLFWIAWTTVQIVKGMSQGLGVWFLPVTLVAVLATSVLLAITAKQSQLS